MKYTSTPWYRNGLTVYALNRHNTNSMRVSLDPGHLPGYDDNETQLGNAKIIQNAAVMYDLLHQAKLQIEYLHEKFQETGSGNAILGRINNILNEIEVG